LKKKKQSLTGSSLPKGTGPLNDNLGSSWQKRTSLEGSSSLEKGIETGKGITTNWGVSHLGILTSEVGGEQRLYQCIGRKGTAVGGGAVIKQSQVKQPPPDNEGGGGYDSRSLRH